MPPCDSYPDEGFFRVQEDERALRIQQDTTRRHI